MSFPPAILELAACGKIKTLRKNSEEIYNKILELIKLARFERKIKPENWKIGMIIINKRPIEMAEQELLELRNANVIVFVTDILSPKDIKKLNEYGLLSRTRLLRPEKI